MKKILSLLSIFLIAVTFAACGTNNKTEEDSGPDESPAIVTFSIPEQIILNDISYVMAANEFEKDELIGYLVNREDYQTFYAENADILYAIDEDNSVINAEDNNRIGIYSVQDYDIEQYISVSDSYGTIFIYVNINYVS